MLRATSQAPNSTGEIYFCAIGEPLSGGFNNMSKALFVLPFLAMALIAANPAPVVPPSALPVPAEVAADPQNRLTLDLSTGGRVVIQLRPDIAPAHVERIRALAQRGFYNGIIFHRVIPGFMAQTGDPTGTGEGGSDLPDLKAEFNALPHLRGTVAMARANEEDSANSQFYIMFAPKFALDHKYTAFGRVIEGMAAIDAVSPGEPPAQPTKIIRASIGALSAAAPATQALPPTETPAEPSGG
jgi:cyclophilin family peptidyl-prolyl cis-trans isomerase